MPINITMPALSPTMEEGTLAKWNVKPGDKVSAGDVIAEIETDKATMEVEAVDEGTIVEILVAAGTEGVKVNAVIAVLAEEGEDASSVSSATVAEAPPSERSAPTSPVLRQAQDEGGGGKQDTNAGTNPPPQAAKLSEGAAPTKLANTAMDGDRIKASPLARRIAALKGVDLSGLTGSGPHGRIVKKDVEAAQPSQVERTSKDAPVLRQAQDEGRVAPDGLILPQILDDRVYAPDSYELVPLDGMRKTVAKRLTQSFMQVPHFPLNVDIALDDLLAFRGRVNAAAPEGIKISVNDLLIKASALALKAVPECNASYSDKGIAYHKAAHVSVAVAVEGGLITPVIFDAEKKGLGAIASEMKDLAARARDRKLKPQEYSGGTFSISNLGMFGIKSFASIINPPEGMILSVGAGEKRPVVGADGELAVGTVMTVTLTCDHRVIGGAEGAKWLAAFKRFVETPEAMLL